MGFYLYLKELVGVTPNGKGFATASVVFATFNDNDTSLKYMSYSESVFESLKLE